VRQAFTKTWSRGEAAAAGSGETVVWAAARSVITLALDARRSSPRQQNLSSEPAIRNFDPVGRPVAASTRPAP
jgi:hypothetical protein